MYVSELHLENVRQFKDETFTFKLGFNLLVGENGEGKTTILKSILAALPKSKSRRARIILSDADVRLHSSKLHIFSELKSADGKQLATYSYSRGLGSRPQRKSSDYRPAVLWYGSTEAACSSFVSQHRKRNFSQDIQIGISEKENWLYEQTNSPAVETDSRLGGFGRSEDIKGFINEILSRFSPLFEDFFWSFEPYNCSLEPEEEGNWYDFMDDTMGKKVFGSALVRYLLESGSSLHGIDSTSVSVDSKGVILGATSQRPITSDFYDFLKKQYLYKKYPQFMENCVIEIHLTPRVRVRTQTGGSFLLSQLSDGEQRLFSLFVDIARQLSIAMPDNVHFRERPAVILIDEIDVHLHPKWQRMIVPALEDLFPSCQFIATTHSPFVVQSVRESNVQHLGGDIIGDFTDRGIEEIAVKVMGIEDPQVSTRYLAMLDTAREYFQLLENTKTMDSAAIKAAKKKLDELSGRHIGDPAYQAYLEVHGKLELGRGD